MNGLIKKVEMWASDRDLLTKSDPKTQLLKSFSEMGELADALAKGDMIGVKDGIGDAVVTLIILAKLCNTDLELCLAHAYNEIKDRKGETVNGTFIKEA